MTSKSSEVDGSVVCVTTVRLRVRGYVFQVRIFYVFFYVSPVSPRSIRLLRVLLCQRRTSAPLRKRALALRPSLQLFAAHETQKKMEFAPRGFCCRLVLICFSADQFSTARWQIFLLRTNASEIRLTEQRPL